MRWAVVGFWWFWGWGTSDRRLARKKLGKKHTPQSWRPPLPYGCHGALPSAPPHKKITNMLCDKSMMLKLNNIIVFSIY
jgi:hypothetical protein